MQKELNIPSIEKVLQHEKIIFLIQKFGRNAVVNTIRDYFDKLRRENITFNNDFDFFAKELLTILDEKFSSTLKKVINASGIILHTNLGRAPLGNYILSKIKNIAEGYSNLEFDLEKGKRGNRNSHIKKLIKSITGAEDAVVVNNNAAAVMLTLLTFAKDKEVIISRGELIEIGGSFRIPDIMKASGAKMIEVGTTNRTKLCDYEKAITSNTAIIFKAHKSNYFIGGFTEEVCIKDLAKLAKKHNLIMYYDLGSGLLKKPKNISDIEEPDVKFAIESGADVISFSGDKLLGGPQAGIIVGKNEFISKIEKNPMMRALRVGKLTLAGLSAVMQSYLNDDSLIKNIPIFNFLSRTQEELENLAIQLQNNLKKNDIESEIIDNEGQCGGGTLPHLRIKSKAIKLILNKEIKASEIYRNLLLLKIPVLSILKKGEIIFDTLALSENDIPIIVNNLLTILKGTK